MKAIALGANGVGIGRPFLYAYSAYGQEGVERAFEILRVSFQVADESSRAYGVSIRSGRV